MFCTFVGKYRVEKYKKQAMSKISIRIYNDRKERAIGDEIN
jgi:hypothetical protein